MHNKIVIGTLLALFFSCNTFAQTWSESGDNHSTGNLSIGAASGNGVLSLSNANYGIKTFDMLNVNTNIYFTDHTLSFVSNSGWTQVPYIQWVAPNGNRQAYLGWQKSFFNLTLENGYDFSINGGNVGMGTTGSLDNARLTIKGGGSNWRMLAFDGNTDDWFMGTFGGGGFFISRDDFGSSNAKFVINGDYVGIGTTAPSAHLEVNGHVKVGSDLTDVSTRINTYGSKLFFLGANNNSDHLWMARYNVSESPNASELRLNIGDDPGHNGDKFVVGVSSGGWHERFVVQGDGKVGIGTSTPDEKLTVAGNIHAQEVKVTIGAGTGPDYVFEPDYNLPTLASIETVIKSEKHLPEIPSAVEMEANGVRLGEMNMLLLKKIEELTLHMIRMDKELQTFRSKKD